MSSLLVFVIFIFCVSSVKQDEIHRLPGWSGALPSRQFSGYLNFTGSKPLSKHMHYWLVESEGNPATDPIIVWLNGGPGCSSLDGFIYEHGPFRLDPEDPTHRTLMQFEYSWSKVRFRIYELFTQKVANMLYLESPVGVGFSYADAPQDYVTNDDVSSQDNLKALMAFFNLYPKFRSHKFFISGESYGGIYVPTLAEAVMWATNNGTWNGPRLLGIAVGNGCTGTEIGVCGGEWAKYGTQFFMSTAIMPQSLKTQIQSTCSFDNISIACQSLLNQYENNMGNVDLYNIYGDCIDGTLQAEMGKRASKVPLPHLGHSSSASGQPGPMPCINSVEASAYFNQPSVMQAMHVKKPPYLWSVCANQINYTSTRPNLPRDTYPALNKFTRVLIYNGDWDACVPYTDNEAWTSSMNYPVQASWHPWYFTDPTIKNQQQVGGYATVYQTLYNFTFITVKGGRHEVPETAPRQAFEMINRLINGKQF